MTTQLQKTTKILPSIKEMVKGDTFSLKCLDKPKMELIQYNSLAKATKSGLPSISKLKKDEGMAYTITLISLWVLDMQEFTNVKTKMTQGQIMDTAQLICCEYPYINVAEINLVFNNAKLGKYGQLYESIDGIKVLAWFRQYSNERFAHFENNLENESSQNKGVAQNYQRSSKQGVSNTSAYLEALNLTAKKK